MSSARLSDTSELSDREWAILDPLIPAAKPGGRPRSVDMREMLTGLSYVLRSGCAWRLVPQEFPPWSPMYQYFRPWRNAGIWETMHTTVRERLRQHGGREPTPSAAIIDSQSVKTTCPASLQTPRILQHRAAVQSHSTRILRQRRASGTRRRCARVRRV